MTTTSKKTKTNTKMRGVYLTHQQWAELDKYAAKKGMTIAEVIRRLVDDFLEAEEEKKFQRKLALLEAKAKSK